MDGVERVMVLGIFAVIVAILSIAAWGVTADEPAAAVATDGGVTSDAGAAVPTSPGTVLPRDGASRAPFDADEDEALRRLLDGRSSPARQPTASGPSAAPTGAADGAGRGRRQGRGAAGGSVAPGAPRGAEGSDSGPVALKNQQRIDTRPMEPLDASAQDSPESDGNTPEAGGPESTLYEIQRGDTLWQIARRTYGEGDMGSMVKLIQQLNPEIDPARLSPGVKILLPTEMPEELVTKTASEAKKPGERLYEVQGGDTLQAIAQRELGDRRRWEEIYTLNKARITRPEALRKGQKILLPPR